MFISSLFSTIYKIKILYGFFPFKIDVSINVPIVCITISLFYNTSLNSCAFIASPFIQLTSFAHESYFVYPDLDIPFTIAPYYIAFFIIFDPT